MSLEIDCEGSSSFAALLTPRGRGAVATVVFEGDLTVIDASGLFHAANGRPLVEQEIDRIVFGHWGEAPAEDVVLCRIAADQIEINCHGGDAASERILSHLESTGAIRQTWQEWTARRDGVFAADTAEALATAATPRAAALIAHQMTGPLRDTLAKLATHNLPQDRAAFATALEGLMQWADLGKHLTRPWNVVLYGEPNVGKSSLINTIVGYQRAIVYDQPGTTRDVVTAETAIDGWPIRLSDTAGMRSEADELEAAGILKAKNAVAEADLRVLVVDRTRNYDPDWSWQLAGHDPHLVVLNKSDLGNDNPVALPDCPTIAVSAKTGEGMKELMSHIATTLVPHPPKETDAVPVSQRQIDVINEAMTAMNRGDDLESVANLIRRIAPRSSVR